MAIAAMWTGKSFHVCTSDEERGHQASALRPPRWEMVRQLGTSQPSNYRRVPEVFLVRGVRPFTGSSWRR